MTTHIALDYIDNNGFRNTCYQLLNEEGKSVAHASFEGTVLTRFDYVESLANEAKEWMKGIRAERRAFLSVTPEELPDFSGR